MELTAYDPDKKAIIFRTLEANVIVSPASSGY
jgi:hypothetical protein